MTIARIDRGPPIPADPLDRMFDRMWRGDTACSAAGCPGRSLTAETRADGAVRFRLSPAAPVGTAV